MQDDLQIQVNETGVDTGTGADIRLSGQNITDAYNQLETNLSNAVNAQLNTIGANATAKGAMLTPTAPTQGISSYDYNRWVAPNLNATIAGLREAGAITAGLQTLNNMVADAQANYNKAVEAARARATAAAASASGGSRGSSTVSETITGATTEAIENIPDPTAQEINQGVQVIYDENGNIVGFSTPATGPDGQPGTGKNYSVEAIEAVNNKNDQKGKADFSWFTGTLGGINPFL